MFKFSSLQRVTNSGTFIPEIDGLRFLAILMVVFYHLDGFLMKELSFQDFEGLDNYKGLHRFLQNGYFGVELFFAISAFVVTLPFANHYLNNKSPIRLKDFFFRRLTRIEPPYLISLLIILGVHLFVLEGEKFSDYTPSFFYSLFYAHGFFYHRDFQPLVNNVTWSLEIEIQFYLLAPLLAYLLIKKNKFGLPLLIFLTIAFTSITKFPKPNFISLYEYFHYFLLGITIAYMRAEGIQWNFLERMNERFSQTLISILCFFLMIFCDITFMGPLHTWFKLLFGNLQMVFMFVVFYNLLISRHTKIWINAPFFTVIGGMCYSIYLFHNHLIMSIGHFLLKVKLSQYFIVEYLIFGFILILCIVLVSLLFFILVERPCMDKNWPIKLLKFFRIY
ncbi:MAG: acyltransferase [Saprospiraceae bacterium]|nr:acyltransferase [Saprospiraceae bacterium]